MDYNVTIKMDTSLLLAADCYCKFYGYTMAEAITHALKGRLDRAGIEWR